MAQYQIIGADDCFTVASDNVFETESDADESLAHLRGEYPGQLDAAYVAEIDTTAGQQ